MPVLSCFTSFGFLEFSSAPSECEKVYRSLVASYRDPITGKGTFDLTIGTHKEAVIFGWANAIAAARVYVRRAAAELRAETAYSLLEEQERRFGMTPGAEDTVIQRQAALAAQQKAARGPRYEAVWEALRAILGTDLVAYRPISISEAEAWPPTLVESPGIFRRPDSIAKSVRFLNAVARNDVVDVDTFSEANEDANENLRDTAAVSGVGQSFTGDGTRLVAARFALSKFGSPTGLARAKIYAHSGTFGTSSLPIGAALATSETFDVTQLTGSSVVYDLAFENADAIILEDGVNYVLTLEYASGSLGNTVDVGYALAGTHAGNRVWYAASTWFAEAAEDLCFHVLTGRPFEVSYENWNRSLIEETIIAGDVLCVDPGNLGLVERVYVTAAEGSGEDRTFTAFFQKPHSAGTYGTTGPVPLWSNTKRHVLVVVKAAAAIDEDTVIRIDRLFQRLMRGCTTWAIVQPTTPGAGTVGPFVIGATTGSPLGAVPLESITL